MAFSMPSIKDLAQTVRTSFRTELPTTDAWLWPSTLHVIAKVFAGITWSLFGRLQWLDRQRFAMTADLNGLLKIGAEMGVGQKTAAYATGKVSVVGTASTAAVTVTIPAGTTFTRSDGITYTSDVATAMSMSGTASITVTASAAGTTSNAVYGTVLTCSDSNVTSASVGADGIGGGSTTETVEEYRARILYRKRNPPQGGSKSDYVIWATSVSGVTRAFVETASCTGIVVVYPMLDTTNASNYGLPTATDIAAVAAYIDAVKPVTAPVVVAAATPYSIDIEVSGLTPDTDAIRTAVANELYATVSNYSGVSITGSISTMYRSHLWSAVNSVTEVSHFQITSPSNDLVLPVGTIPVVRSVKFT